MTFAYAFGGIAVRSPVALPGLRPCPAPPPEREIALSVEPGDGPVADCPHFAWPGRYRLTLGTYRGAWLFRSMFDGAFLIGDDARSVRIFCGGGTLSQELVDVLVRRILPRLATRFGATALHSAALSDGAGGLLLIGASGAGKSTLAAALERFAGMAVLSDDISILWGERAPIVAPAAIGVSIWPESLAGLRLDPAAGDIMPGYGDKRRFTGAAGSAEAVPLRCVVFPERVAEAGPAVIQPLPLAEAMAAIAAQAIHFNPGAPYPAERAVVLERILTILRSVPAYRLRYPSDYQALPEVTALLRAQLAG